MSTIDLSSKQLRRAAIIKDRITALQSKLARLLNGSPAADKASFRGPGRPRRRKVSAAGRARMAAAQRARWAKLKGK
jgi:hypothetical protein